MMKTSRVSRKTCIYCGTDENLTVDHVPPKSFLTRPYPANLITVPACVTCNQSFQKDDDYTRTVLTMDVRASKNAAAQSNLQAVLRSLQRPDAKGFVEYITRRSTTGATVGPEGHTRGRIFDVERARVNRAGERLIRALFFVETGAPIPDGAAMRVEAKMDLHSTQENVFTIARVMRTLPDRRDGNVGTAFSYIAAFGESFSVWLLLLYDFFFWAGTVDLGDVK
jgi:HNH endonuclease